jgi:hypothetical protein
MYNTLSAIFAYENGYFENLQMLSFLRAQNIKVDCSSNENNAENASTEVLGYPPSKT